MKMNNFANEMYEARMEARAKASEAQKQESVHVPRFRQEDSRQAFTCHYCHTSMKAGALHIRKPDGSHVCGDCHKSEKRCLECGSVFVSRVNNQKTCRPECGRAYELRRSRERYQAMRALVCNLTLTSEGGY